MKALIAILIAFAFSSAWAFSAHAASGEALSAKPKKPPISDDGPFWPPPPQVK